MRQTLRKTQEANETPGESALIIALVAMSFVVTGSSTN